MLQHRLDKSGPDTVKNIPFDVDITIYEETRLKMNHEVHLPLPGGIVPVSETFFFSLKFFIEN